MRNRSFKHIAKHFTCWILFLQMVNLSINRPDFREFEKKAVAQHSEQPFAEIETIYELVAEGIFDKDIPDSEDEDIDSSFKPFDLYSSSLKPADTNLKFYPVEHASFYQTDFSLFESEPTSPPPKQA